MSYSNTKVGMVKYRCKNDKKLHHYGYQVTGPLRFNERVWMTCDLIKGVPLFLLNILL